MCDICVGIADYYLNIYQRNFYMFTHTIYKVIMIVSFTVFMSVELISGSFKVTSKAFKHTRLMELTAAVIIVHVEMFPHL